MGTILTARRSGGPSPIGGGPPVSRFAIGWLDCSPAADRAQDGDQDAGTDECDEDRAGIQASHATATAEREDETTDQGHNDADNDVADNPVAAALHHYAGEETSDQAEENPTEDTSENHLFRNTCAAARPVYLPDSCRFAESRKGDDGQCAGKQR